MGRAIVREPKAFLMDEPLSNLDAKLRVQMRAEIARIQQTLQVTTLYVTHDQVEAMTMGHRVAVMRDGILQQVDSPQRLYDAPVNLFVASFVGSPAMNLLEAELVRADGSLVCRLGADEIELPRDVVARRPGLEARVGGTIGVGIRPEDVRLGDVEGTQLAARVLLVESLGAEQLVHLEIAATPLQRTELVDAATQPSETDVFGRSSTLLGRFDRNFLLQPGEAVEVTIDPHRLHFFELDSGAAIQAVDVPVALDRAAG
jgi:multiple sugar transport system ATP-binding protein